MPEHFWARSAFALTLLLVLGILYSLVRAVWWFTAGPPNQRVASTAQAPQSHAVASAHAFNLERVVSQHMFGVAAPIADPSAQQMASAPVTQLALELLGVFEADRPKESSAVIAEQNGDGEVYNVGDNVPGNAVLTEVHGDRVVLQRGAELEILKFAESPDAIKLDNLGNSINGNSINGNDVSDPGVDGVDTQELERQAVQAAEQEVVPNAVPPQARNGASVGSSVAHYGNRFKNDPSQVLNELGVQPISASGAQGYRIGSASTASGFAQVGLQPGDVVLSVNGQAVGNVQSDRRQIDSIRAQGSAKLEVQRGNRRFFVTAALQ